MHGVIQAELFIRSLTKALEADRLIQRTIRDLKSKEHTEKFVQLCWSHLNNAMRTLEPLDRIQRSKAEKTTNMDQLSCVSQKRDSELED